jgi:hypothetical protein
MKLVGASGSSRSLREVSFRFVRRFPVLVGEVGRSGRVYGLSLLSATLLVERVAALKALTIVAHDVAIAVQIAAALGAALEPKPHGKSPHLRVAPERTRHAGDCLT